VTLWIIKASRRHAFTVQGGKCFWCDRDMISFNKIKDQSHAALCTAEHLIPRSQGGRDTGWNIVAACNDCNSARKDNLVHAWFGRFRLRLSKAGNPDHLEVVLQKLLSRGIDPRIVGQLSNDPDVQLTAERPPPKANKQAPKG
jgi:hypothetical protein